MRDSNLDAFIFVEAMDYMVSCTQAVSFYLGKNALRERFWMYHPIHVLCPERQLSPAIL